MALDPTITKYGRYSCLAVLFLLPDLAVASPPPTGSPTAQAVGRFSEWLRSQELSVGNNWRIGCCSDADGGVVEVRISPDAEEGHYEIKFRDIDDFTARGADPPPEAATWYPVPKAAVLRNKNPTGFSWAWWAPQYRQAQHGSPIRCFIPDDLQ